jgi:hypothetical protein
LPNTLSAVESGVESVRGVNVNPLSKRLVTAASVGATLLACGPAEDELATGNRCGPNSSFSEDHGHCHCDAGFEIQGTACLPIRPDDGSDTIREIELDGAIVTGQSTTDRSGNPIYLLQAVAADVVLLIEGYVGLGAPSAPETIELEGAELSYATCAVCVVVQTGCYAHDDHFHCSRNFMPSGGGQVEFTAVDVNALLEGHLHGVTLQPVEISSNYETTPAEGERRRISHWGFSAALQSR